MPVAILNLIFGDLRAHKSFPIIDFISPAYFARNFGNSLVFVWQVT